MRASEFDPVRFGRGEKYALELHLDPPANDVRIPVLLVRGKQPGKTLALFAGVHGDEYEGIRAIIETYTALAPLAMSGDFLAVPIANPPAFWAGTRTNPVDGENLARLFPGSYAAGPTAAIAQALTDSVLSRADFLLDLHSAGVKLLMPTLVGYDDTDERSLAAAMIFGAPIVWAHSHVPPGRTVSTAKAHGIPWLYTEARGAGRIHPDDLLVFKRGIENLLHHLAIVPGEPQARRIDLRLYGDGDIDESMVAKYRGLFIPKVGLLQPVERGEELGRIIDYAGQVLETYRAPRSGVVVLIRQSLAIVPGDSLFLITGCAKDG